jgi:hypothetical protein
MAALKFALEINEPKRLVFRWSGNRKYPKGDIEVLFDDQLTGMIFKRDEFRKNQELSLPDGSRINVEIMGENITVFRNGICLNDTLVRKGRLGNLNLYISFFVSANLWLAVSSYFGRGIAQSSINAIIFLVFALIYIGILVLYMVIQRWTTVAAVIYMILASTNLVLWAVLDGHSTLNLLIVKVILEIVGIVSSVMPVLELIKKQKKKE